MKPFDITTTAKTQIEKLLTDNPGNFAVSLSVKGGGCAGFKYQWGFAKTKDDVEKADHTVEWENGRFTVDATSLLYVMGTTIDYKQEVFLLEQQLTAWGHKLLHRQKHLACLGLV